MIDVDRAAAPGNAGLYLMRQVPNWTAITVLTLFGAGCNSGPSAPVLSDSRIYQNPAEGFRLLIPEGWIQISSSLLPPGKLNGEIFLVRYNLTTAEMGASFQVVCIDDTPNLDLEAHHSQESFRVVKWQTSEPRKEVTIGGAKGEQMVYTARIDNRPITKMVTCFRRDGRVYSLTGVYWTNDENAKQQIERATNDIIWES